jgi:hypothetical protein
VQRPFFDTVAQLDIEATRIMLKAAGADARQNAEFVQAVLVNVRF